MIVAKECSSVKGIVVVFFKQKATVMFSSGHNLITSSCQKKRETGCVNR